MCDDQVATFHAPQPMYMKDQSTLSLMIIVLVLAIFFLDNVLIPLGEKLMSFILGIYLLFSLSSLQISI